MCKRAADEGETKCISETDPLDIEHMVGFDITADQIAECGKREMKKRLAAFGFDQFDVTCTIENDTMEIQGQSGGRWHHGTVDRWTCNWKLGATWGRSQKCAEMKMKSELPPEEVAEFVRFAARFGFKPLAWRQWIECCIAENRGIYNKTEDGEHQYLSPRTGEWVTLEPHEVRALMYLKQYRAHQEEKSSHIQMLEVD